MWAARAAAAASANFFSMRSSLAQTLESGARTQANITAGHDLRFSHQLGVDIALRRRLTCKRMAHRPTDAPAIFTNNPTGAALFDHQLAH
jgi:hypothetical protein